ncbi:MAG: hypothetical protein ABSC32_13570 [Steroidobacteraceae bacterium]|jgi:hypothetical protein
MIDPEVARLRRLRGEALLVREIARAFESTQWAADESLPARSACAGWRIARVVSGRLKSHPYAEYQKDAGVAAHVRSRMHAYVLALTRNNRAQGLKTLEAHVNALGRQLNDAIALAWSSDFSEALSRSQSEIKDLGAALARETRSGEVLGRPGVRPSRPEQAVGNLAVGNLAAIDGDWPYLAL